MTKERKNNMGEVFHLPEVFYARMNICININIYTYIQLSLSILKSISIYLSICINLSISLLKYIYLFINLSIYPFMYPCIHLSIYHPFIHLSIYTLPPLLFHQHKVTISGDTLQQSQRARRREAREGRLADVHH